MSVCVVGAFPPPTHGMSLVNERMCDEIVKTSLVRKINITPGTSSGVVNRKLSRTTNVVTGLLKFLRSHRDCKTIYIGLSGGLGQIYELAFILLARFTRKKIFIHHHSYAYIDRFSYIFNILLILAGPTANHIVLSKLMGKRIKSQYPRVIKLVVLSNSAFISQKDYLPKKTKKSICVGYISNISFDKGIEIFFEALSVLQTSDICFTAEIAGPYTTPEAQLFVEKKLLEFPNVKYLGSVDEEDKESFFSSIDIMLFPTMYRNEAQPLIIFEALASGVPVVALERGSIAETINCKNGLLVKKPENFANQSTELIKRLYLHKSLLESLSQNAHDIFSFVHHKALDELKSLARQISSNDSSLKF